MVATAAAHAVCIDAAGIIALGGNTAVSVDDDLPAVPATAAIAASGTAGGTAAATVVTSQSTKRPVAAWVGVPS